MIWALTNLFASKKEEPRGFSGTSAILMADSRDVAQLSEHVSPADLVESLNRVTAALISAVEKNGGIVHVHIGGSLIAYWPPSTMA